MRLFFIIPILFFLRISYSQTHETIRTGRPGQSIGGNVVGTGLLQIQSGLDAVQDNKDLFESDTYLLSNVIRFGLNEKFEVSMVANIQSQEIQNNNINSTRDGLNSLQVGSRYNIIPTSDGLIPALGVQARIKLTAVDSDYRDKHAIPIITIASVHNLSHRFNLFTNLGGEFNADKNAPSMFYTLNLSYSINNKWGSFIENYGNVDQNLFYSYMDGGLSYLLNKDHQLDMSLGWGHNHGVQHHFVSVGISSRFRIFN